MGATLKRREGSRRGVAGVSATFCTILLCAFCTSFRAISDVFWGAVVKRTTHHLACTVPSANRVRQFKEGNTASYTGLTSADQKAR